MQQPQQALSAKQLANRRYYEQNREKIRARKKKRYLSKKKHRQPKAHKPKNESAITMERIPRVKTKKERPWMPVVSEKDHERMVTRRKIEDILLARELGLTVNDF